MVSNLLKEKTKAERLILSELVSKINIFAASLMKRLNNTNEVKTF